MPGMKSVVGMGGMGDARELAEMLRQLGRGRDTVLAHITPEEAQMLMDMGGSGGTNPNTGLPEFQEEEFVDYGESYGNVTNQPLDYSYMAPESVSFGSGFPSAQPELRQVFQQPAPVVEAQAPETQFDFGFGPGRYAPDYGPADVRGMQAEQFARFTPEQPSIAQRAEGALQGVQDLTRRYPRLTEALGMGAQGIAGLIQAQRARKQGQQEAARLSELGRPMREQAEALRQQALTGALTPQQAAAQEAQRARARQSAAARGVTTGTQAQMIENQLARQRSELSQTNLNNALRMLNLANAYDEAAIKASLAANREADDLLAEIFSNIAFTRSATPAARPQAPQQPTQQREITRRPEVPRGE